MSCCADPSVHKPHGSCNGNQPPTHTETRTEHYYQFYGRVVSGYGPSMDPHRCGHPDEPCITIKKERQVSDWVVVGKETKGEIQPQRDPAPEGWVPPDWENDPSVDPARKSP